MGRFCFHLIAFHALLHHLQNLLISSVNLPVLVRGHHTSIACMPCARRQREESALALIDCFEQNALGKGTLTTKQSRAVNTTPPLGLFIQTRNSVRGPERLRESRKTKRQNMTQGHQLLHPALLWRAYTYAWHLPTNETHDTK